MPSGCIEVNCNIAASFNYIENKKPIYCNKHKKDRMINVSTINKQCIDTNCITRALFNYINETKGIYCSKHKKDGMFDVVSRKCAENDCNLLPNYNYSNLKSSIYCSIHKKDGMIDVRHFRCQYTSCTTLASFNYAGNINALYCLKHKLDNMVDVRAPKCREDACSIYPCYNYEGNKKPIYCKAHKLDNMIDVVNTHCKTPLCYTTISNIKYNGYCFFCYYNLFPDSNLSRNFKTKENSVTDFIKENFKEYTIIVDKPIYDGCSKRRPDIFIDLGYQVVIVEIDENQHITYDLSCENKRLMEISKDINHRPLIFIQFNPDSYINNGNKIKSCWSINGHGISVINKNNKNNWNTRLDILKDTINKWINTISTKIIERVYLFYDN